MIKTVRTDSHNQDFIDLVRSLDADLAIRDKEDHSFNSQFNKIDLIKYAVVAYEHNFPLGCGAIKAFDANIMEIKRMYVIPESREKGIASKILNELEAWALELSYKKCKLETGIKQPEAIRLYIKNGYRRIPNYGHYVGIIGSLCFEKELG